MHDACNVYNGCHSRNCSNGHAVCNTCYFHNDSNGYNGSDDHSAWGCKISLHFAILDILVIIAVVDTVIMASMAITTVMATLAVIDIMVWMTSITVIATTSLEDFEATLTLMTLIELK